MAGSFFTADDEYPFFRLLAVLLDLIRYSVSINNTQEAAPHTPYHSRGFQYQDVKRSMTQNCAHEKASNLSMTVI